MAKEKFEMFACEPCDGSGYVDEWSVKENPETGFQDKVLMDCDQCNGTGKVRIKIVDKRVKTKNQKAVYLLTVGLWDK